MFKRETQIKNVQSESIWDIVVIGGGATGLGVAVDAASRGYKTLLLERDDFAKGTSSRSTKLVHGGVRYLANGDVKLVYTALKERWYIFKNANHVSRVQSFVIPCYTFVDKWKYLIGLKLYDWLAGKFSIGRSVFVAKNEVSEMLSNIKTTNLYGGVKYFDGQFDDARLAVNLAQTAVEHGASVLNYANVEILTKNDAGKISGLTFIDRESGKSYSVKAKCVVNATGVFVDDVLSMDNPRHKKTVRPSQGIHLVVDQKFMPKGQDALMIPKTSDGRVLFGVPWHQYLVLGTTDTPIDEALYEPRALEEEVQFVLNTARAYMTSAPKREDVKSVFAGLRPLAATEGDDQKTKEISRDHKLIVGQSNLVTITGGKWTTYRKMAEETVDKVVEVALLSKRACVTKNLRIHGNTDSKNVAGHLSIYGLDAVPLKQLEASSSFFLEKLVEGAPYSVAEVVWVVRNEMARTVEDVLSRRLRLLFLDAKLAMKAAPLVAKILAEELGRDSTWQESQISEFEQIANGYLLSSPVVIEE